MKNNEIKQQFTKIAEDLYSTFDSVSKTGDFKSTKELCDYLVGLRGGKPLTNEFYSLLDNTSVGESFGVTSSALELNKKASDKVEMWKLADVNGQMVFVANDTGLEVKGDDEEENELNKTASLHKIKHTYKVAIKTGSLSKTAQVMDLLKSQGYDDEDFFVNPSKDTVVVNMESDLAPSKLTNQVADDLNKGYAGVPSCNIECCHDFCNCGSEPFDYPDLGADEFILIIPNGKNMIGNNVQTLVEYANANEIPSFKVHASNGDVIYNSEDVKEAPITKEGEDAFQKQDGTIVSKQELESDPNALTEGEEVKVVNVETTGKFINDLLEKKSTNLTFADKTLLRYAMAKGWVEKVAYVSDESFAIKAGDATITVDNDKANVIPPGAFTDGIQCDPTPTNADTDENIDVL